MVYAFDVDCRVRSRADFGKTGYVVGTVPGNGSYGWYFVSWDDGSSDHYVAEDLESEWL